MEKSAKKTDSITSIEKRKGKWLVRTGVASLAVAGVGLLYSVYENVAQDAALEKFRAARTELTQRAVPETLYQYLTTVSTERLTALADSNHSRENIEASGGSRPSSVSEKPITVEQISVPNTRASIRLTAEHLRVDLPENEHTFRELARNNILSNVEARTRQCVIVQGQIQLLPSGSEPVPPTVVCKDGKTTSLMPFDRTATASYVYLITSYQQFLNFLAGRPHEQEIARLAVQPQREVTATKNEPDIISDYIANLQGSRLQAVMASSPVSGAIFDKISVPDAQLTLNVGVSSTETIRDWSTLEKYLARSNVLASSEARAKNCVKLDFVPQYDGSPKLGGTGYFRVLLCYANSSFAGQPQIFTDPSEDTIKPLRTSGEVKVNAIDALKAQVPR